MDIKKANQDIALFEEFNTSIKLVKLGFGEIQNLDYTNSFYFLPFQLLSQGFERLMKSYICLGYLENNGDYPNLSYIKGLGHDLRKLLQVILSDYYSVDARPVLADDKHFLASNTEFKELLNILSEFGKLARYHNFDIITGNSNPSINPEEYWNKFESKILRDHPEMFAKLLNNDQRYEVYGAISRHIIIIFEKYMATLGRQVIFGTLGTTGRRLGNFLYDFGMLYEKDFGTTDYRKDTTRFKMRHRTVHKRNIIDFFQRRFNPRYTSKRIFRYQHTGDWPFYSDEVIIERRHTHWCVVTIAGRDYALNGSAKGRYNLDDPYEGGVAIVGMNISDFIQLALAL